MNTIIFAGGGTAGHVEPALSVAHQWMKENPHDQCIFIGTKLGLETSLVPAAGFTLQTIKKVIVPFLSRVFVVSFGLVFLSTTMLVLSTLLMLASQTSDDNNKNSSRRYSSSATVEIPVRLIFDSISNH
jgi:hypothetical protein